MKKRAPYRRGYTLENARMFRDELGYDKGVPPWKIMKTYLSTHRPCFDIPLEDVPLYLNEPLDRESILILKWRLKCAR